MLITCSNIVKIHVQTDEITGYFHLKSNMVLLLFILCQQWSGTEGNIFVFDYTFVGCGILASMLPELNSEVSGGLFIFYTKVQMGKNPDDDWHFTY